MRSNLLNFTLIYNKYKKPLYYYVLKMVNDTMLAEDIIQNVFLSLYENIESIKKKNSVSFWLFKNARNKVYMHYRSNSVRKMTELDEELADSEDIEKSYERQELKDIISEELNNLSDAQKEIFILREYSELSYKELASLLDIDENNVKARLFKARKNLIERVEKIVIER